MGGPLSVVKVSIKFQHPMSTPYYFSILIILSVTHLSTAADDSRDFAECHVVFTNRVGKVVFVVSPGQILVVGLISKNSNYMILGFMMAMLLDSRVS